MMNSAHLTRRSGYWKGFWAPWEAFKMILRSPRMATLVLIPLIISIGLYVLFFTYGSQYFETLIVAWTQQLSSLLPDWAWLVVVTQWGLRLLAWLALALVAALSFTIVSGIILAPFNDMLSKAALRIHLINKGVTNPPVEKDLPVGQTITLEIKRMVVLILGAVLAGLFGAIPFMQLPALAMGAILVSFEYYGYPISRRTPKLGPVAWFALKHPLVSMGFGTFLLLIMALPFTSVLYIPLAVVAGTTLYADLELDQ